MGWLFSTRWSTRAELVAHLRSLASGSESKYEIVRASVIGNHHWYIGRRRDTGVTWIGLDLLQGGKHDGLPSWGYKDMDESMGPCYYDCPLSFLEQVPLNPAYQYAAGWREKVRQFHADREARKSLKPGDHVEYAGHVYELERPASALGKPASTRYGWNVRRVPGGAQYRMKAHQLADSKIVKLS